MMNQYCINENQQSSGDYEVHTDECSFLPNTENRINLGWHLNCESAVKLAKETYPGNKLNINGCFYCCYTCHTS